MKISAALTDQILGVQLEYSENSNIAISLFPYQNQNFSYKLDATRYVIDKHRLIRVAGKNSAAV